MNAGRDNSNRTEHDASSWADRATHEAPDPDRGHAPNQVADSSASTLVDATKQYAHYATVGVMFPVAIALGFFGGYLLDRWLGTVPFFALVGLGLGVVSAIRNLLRIAATDDDAIKPEGR